MQKSYLSRFLVGALSCLMFLGLAGCGEQKAQQAEVKKEENKAI